MFGRRRLPQLACAAVAGLLPMATFISTVGQPRCAAHHTLDARAVARRAGDQPPRPGGDVIALCAVDRRRDPDQSDLLRAGRARRAGSGDRLVASRPAPERQRAAARPRRHRRSCFAVPVLGWLALAHALVGRRSPPSARPPHTPSTSASSSATSGSSTCPACRSCRRSARPLSCLSTTSGLRQGTGTFGWLDVFGPTGSTGLGAVIAAGSRWPPPSSSAVGA